MKNIIALFLMFFLFSSCREKSNPVSTSPSSNSSGPIQTGETVTLASQTVNPTGGSFTINKPNDPLNGLTLTVSANSFSKSVTFNISYAPIISHSLGQIFHPVSPLIEIGYTGEYSSQPMKLRIPITLPQGNFAMGFYYDKTTGELEAIPVDDLGNDYIILSTMHFTSSSTTILKRGTIKYPTPVTDIVITSADDALLSSQNMIDSYFTPGVDDWEFINYGSYIAPSGHCAGQSISALWYYDEKKLKGSPPLFHQFDLFNDRNKPDSLWEDNPRGYRLASTVQCDGNYDVWVDNVLDQSTRPEYTFKSFALAIAQLHKPQLVLIRKSTPPNEGHAMIVYKVDYPNKRLFIADPNFPNNRARDGTQSIRFIDLVVNKLGPYHSSLNASKPGVDFDQIGFAGKSAYVDWTQIQRRWSELEAGTIGNDRFRDYQLNDLNNPGFTLSNGYINSSDTLIVTCRSTTAEQWIVGTDHLQFFYIFDTTGVLLARGDYADGIASMRLKKGNNKLGFYICGGKNRIGYNYVDFKWLTIGCSSLKISPDSTSTDAFTECTFTANIQGSIPASPKYVWDFGDSTAQVAQTTTNTAKHTYTRGGNYRITLGLYDNTNGRLLAQASSPVTVTKSILEKLAGTTDMHIYLSDVYTTNNPSIPLYTGVPVNVRGTNDQDGTIRWNGRAFTFIYSYQSVSLSEDTIKVSGTIIGTFSENGRILMQISGTENTTHTKTPEYSNVTLAAHDVPYFSMSPVWIYDQYSYQIRGDSVRNYISNVSVMQKLYNDATKKYEDVNSVLFTYDFNSYIDIVLYVKTQ